jgi:hypothetical protein
MAGETEVLREILPRRHFVHHKSHLTRPGIEPGPPRWEASDELLQLWRGLPADMLHRTWQELEYHLDLLCATKGAHIEVY